MNGIYENKKGTRIEIENGIIKATGQSVAQSDIDELVASGELRRISEDESLDTTPAISSDTLPSSSSANPADNPGFSSGVRESAPSLGPLESAAELSRKKCRLS